jgi:hypothetical protein
MKNPIKHTETTLSRTQYRRIHYSLWFSAV